MITEKLQNAINEQITAEICLFIWRKKVLAVWHTG